MAGDHSSVRAVLFRDEPCASVCLRCCADRLANVGTPSGSTHSHWMLVHSPFLPCQTLAE